MPTSLSTKFVRMWELIWGSCTPGSTGRMVYKRVIPVCSRTLLVYNAMFREADFRRISFMYAWTHTRTVVYTTEPPLT